MKARAQALLGVLEKSAADSRLLALHFTSAGAVAVDLDLSGAKPRILRLAHLFSDASLTDQEKKNGFLNFLSGLRSKKYPPAALTWADGMTYRQLELPPMPVEDLVKAVEWDLKKKYYFNPDENFLGFREVMEVEGEEGRDKLFNIFYCEKAAAESRLSFVQELGLEIRSMVPAQAALSDLVWRSAPVPEHDILVCELDGAALRILIAREGRNMLVRQVSLGPDQPVTDDLLRKVVDEIKKTVDFYESQKYFRPVGKVVLAGAWQGEERACAFLAQNLELKVERLDIESYLSDSLPAEDREFARANGGLFAAPLGAVALQEDSMNLVPADIKTKNRARRLQRWLDLGLLGLAFLLFLVIIGLSANTQVMKQRMNELEKQYAEINQKKQVFETVLGLERVRRSIFRGEVYSPSLLKDFSLRTPAIISLNDMEYNRQEGTLIVHGQVSESSRESMKSVTQYAAALAESLFFTSVTVTNTSRDEEKKVLVFEITGVLKGLL